MYTRVSFYKDWIQCVINGGGMEMQKFEPYIKECVHQAIDNEAKKLNRILESGERTFYLQKVPKASRDEKLGHLSTPEPAAGKSSKLFK